MQRKARQKDQYLKIDKEATRILRTVKDEEAFHFYAAVGQPTGEKATSLIDFLEKAKTVRFESLAFHLQRKDFEKWLQETIGDSKLAKKVGGIIASNDDKTRTRILTTIENHIKDLRREAPKSLPVRANILVAPAP